MGKYVCGGKSAPLDTESRAYKLGALISAARNLAAHEAATNNPDRAMGHVLSLTGELVSAYERGDARQSVILAASLSGFLIQVIDGLDRFEPGLIERAQTQVTEAIRGHHT